MSLLTVSFLFPLSFETMAFAQSRVRERVMCVAVGVVADRCVGSCLPCFVSLFRDALALLLSFLHLFFRVWMPPSSQLHPLFLVRSVLSLLRRDFSVASSVCELLRMYCSACHLRVH